MKGDINGVAGSKQGELTASFNELEWAFGQPQFEGIGDGITTEYSIDYLATDKDGEVTRGNFRLYDWNFGRDLRNSSGNTLWNVGGTTPLDYNMALEAMWQFNETDLKYGENESCVLESELVVC